MKKILILLLCFAQSNLFSMEKNQPALSEIWSLGDRHYPFLRDPHTKALISRKCIESARGCQALKAVNKKLKMTFTEAELSGGKNPSSLLCKKGFNGEVLVLKDQVGNENSFCKFSDQSMVNANEL